MLSRLRQQQYQIDSISLSLITLQILVNFWLTTQYATSSPYTALISIAYLTLTITGLSMHHFFCGGIKFDKTLVAKELSQLFLYVISGFLFVLVFQTIIFKATAGVIALNTLFETGLFYTSAAISEESFFRYYIQTKLEQSLRISFFNTIIAILLTSTLFTVFHFVVYRTMLYALFAVFASSIVLCITYAYGKRLTVPMLIHVLTNLAAVLFAR
jgi:membrane protease YdiL (CAAX protease family)